MKIVLSFLLVFSLSTAALGQAGLIFNGTDFPTILAPWGWGQSTIEIEQA